MDCRQPAPPSMMELPPGWEQFAARVRVNVEDQHGRQLEHHSEGCSGGCVATHRACPFEASLSVCGISMPFGQPLEQQRTAPGIAS